MESQPRDRINLNTASEAELETLSGIGPELARAIVADREEYGPYEKISDVTRVSGIGEKLFEHLREYIYVGEEDVDGEVEPIVFRGEASNLRAVISVVNRGRRPIRRARLPVEQSNLLTARGEPLAEIVVKQRLQPGQSGKAVVSVAVHLSTPPGIHYGGELVTGEERRPIYFYIAEKLQVRVVPAELIIDNVPGSTVEKTLFVTNTGNIPITVNDIGPVGIEETDITNRVLRSTIAQLNGGGIDAGFDVLTDELKEAFARSRILNVLTMNKPVEVPPGETRALELQISLPESMPTTYAYKGEIRLYDARVRLSIQPKSVPKG